jgi:SAM-dependent methyltransferase
VSGQEPPWWQSLYDETVAELLLARPDPAELLATADFLTARLQLGPGRTVFDQCCGIGTLSLALARRGVRVIGVDLSAPYIDRARRAAEGLPCAFHHGDAFAFVPPAPCDAAFNWGTGFGNAADDADNRRMLRRAYEALVPGGRFALEFQNIPRVLRGFQRCLLRRGATRDGEVLLLRESTVALAEGLLRQTWTFVLPDGTQRVRHSAVRLYLPHQIADLLRACGFADLAFFGSARGEPLDLDSSRCICVARRPP